MQLALGFRKKDGRVLSIVIRRNVVDQIFHLKMICGCSVQEFEGVPYLCIERHMKLENIFICRL